MKHILFVDDEADIRFFTTDALDDFGHSVTEAASGQAALAEFNSAAPEIDILITDLGLGAASEISGIALVKKLREIRPSLPVIVISGDTNELDDVVDAFPDVITVRKPFRSADLNALINELVPTVLPGAAIELVPQMTISESLHLPLPPHGAGAREPDPRRVHASDSLSLV